MPRAARTRSSTGVYHVVVRGINKQPIFHDNHDYRSYLDALEGAKEKAPFLLFAYCLMNNHIHLLIQEQEEPVGDTMKRIGASYVYWYNRKYGRIGPLFQGRFHSEAVEDDSYLLTVLRYIHQNPVKAGISQYCGGYVWSSHRAYEAGDSPSKLVDTSFPLGVIGGRGRLLKFVSAEADDHCLDLEAFERLGDDAVLALLATILQTESVSDLSQLSQERRTVVLRQLSGRGGISTRQIARLTGMGRWLLEKRGPSGKLEQLS